MTEQSATPNESADGRGFSFEPHLVSLLFHAGLIGLVVWVASSSVSDRTEIIEVEIVEILPPEEPAAPPREPVAPPAVPELERIEKVETPARPYHPAAAAINRLQREPPPPDRSPGLPASFAIPMEATVQGGTGIEVMAVAAAGANVLADPNKPFWPDGGDGFPDAEYADTWEITVEPEPINDRDFKPVYPTDARSRRVEAVVEVELLVDSTGTVADTRVLESGGDQFSTSALEYCRRLKFKPALANQVPVASRIVWVVAYRFGNR